MENHYLPPKPFHPLHTLIDKTPEELSALEASGEISEQDAMGTRWRKALLAAGASSGGSEMKRYLQMKEQQKAAEAEAATKE